MQDLTFPFTRNTEPPFLFDRLTTEKGHLYVMRDDLLPAGTKQRAILPLLSTLKARGVRRVTYASPFAGFAQVALAYGAGAIGMECTLFCERDPQQPGQRPHRFTELAASWGAKIILVDTLAAGEEGAAFAEKEQSIKKIPLGFHCSEFQVHFQKVVKSGLLHLQNKLGNIPPRIWLPLGSGTLARAFRESAPLDTELHCVDVHVLPSNDPRILSLRELPNVTYYSAPQSFAEAAKEAPPIPSNLHYDAKLWPIVKNSLRSGDLWWNVAR